MSERAARYLSPTVPPSQTSLPSRPRLGKGVKALSAGRLLIHSDLFGRTIFASCNNLNGALSVGSFLLCRLDQPVNGSHARFAVVATLPLLDPLGFDLEARDFLLQIATLDYLSIAF